MKEKVERGDGAELGEEREEGVLVHARMEVAHIQPVFEEHRLRRRCLGALGGRAGLVVLVWEGEERGRR